MEFKDRLKAARKARGWTQSALAERLGVTTQAVSAWERGLNNPEYSRAEEIFRMLEDPAAGTGGFAVAAHPLQEPHLEPDVDLSKAEPVPPNRRFSGPRDVPVLGTAVGGGNEDGDFRFNGDTIDYAPRPPGIANRKDVYALYVENDSMAPKYEPGERLYIDPHRAPRTMDYVVVELHGPEEGEPGKGFIKRLVKKTPGRIVLEQFNPPKELEFDQSQVKLLHRVIPYDELLGI